MTPIDTESTRKELMQGYPRCRVKVVDNRREMVAEVSEGFAVAVTDRSQPHFHLRMRETYRVLRGTLMPAPSGFHHAYKTKSNSPRRIAAHLFDKPQDRWATRHPRLRPAEAAQEPGGHERRAGVKIGMG